jgi:hypothetical protein
VSEDNINILINVDFSEAELELQDFENEINKKASLWQRVKLKILTESRQVLRTIAATVRTIQSIMAALNITLGPFGDALIEMGMAVINTAIAIQYSYAAAGPIGWALVGLSLASMFAALYASAQAADNVQDARQAARRAESIMSNISALLGPWR